MERLIIKILSATFIVLLSGCGAGIFEVGREIKYEYDPNFENSQIVIDALVTTKKGEQRFKITQTVAIDDPGSFPNVENAQVVIEDTKGGSWNYAYNPFTQEYENNDFAAEKGETYTLTVTADIQNGKGPQTYTATETAPDVNNFAIDSIVIFPAVYEPFGLSGDFLEFINQTVYLASDPNEQLEFPNGQIFNRLYYVNINTEETIDEYNYGDFSEFEFSIEPYIHKKASETPGEPINVYNIRLYAKENPNETNFYEFSVRRNGFDWFNTSAVPIADDVSISENISGIRIPGTFVEGDTIEGVMYGLTFTTYRYLLGINNVLDNDGGLFSPPPGNPPNNLSNDALGNFQISPIAKYSIRINDEGKAEFVDETRL